MHNLKIISYFTYCVICNDNKVIIIRIKGCENITSGNILFIITCMAA